MKSITKQFFVRVDNMLFENIAAFSMNEKLNRFEK